MNVVVTQSAPLLLGSPDEDGAVTGAWINAWQPETPMGGRTESAFGGSPRRDEVRGASLYHRTRLPQTPAPGCPSWRQASYTATAAALERFKERIPGRMGIRRRSVIRASNSTSGARPVGSGPNRRTSPG